MSEVNNTEVKLSEATLKAIEVIRPTITITDNGDATYDNSFEKMLPEKYTLKDVKEVQNLINTFEAAANYVVAEQAPEFFTKNKDITAISGKTSVGRDTYNVSVARTAYISAGLGVAERRQVHNNVTSSIRGSNPEAKRVNTIARSLGERLREN